MNLYRIDGGVGKSIMFTSLVEQLAKRDGGHICIETAYPEVFNGVPGVDIAYHSGQPKDPKQFYKYFDKVYAAEPYNGNFWKGDVHLLNAWAFYLGLPEIKEPKKQLPVLSANIPIPPQRLQQIFQAIGSENFIVIQISGGQSPYELQGKDPTQIPYTANPMRQGRNMTAIDPLVAVFKDKLGKDFKLVQFGLPNEPMIKDAVQLGQLGLHFVEWFAVFQRAAGFIGIDSMMAHAMASYKKPGVVFWEGTSPDQFGWEYKGRLDLNSALPNGITVTPELADKAIQHLTKYIKKTENTNIPRQEEVVTAEVEGSCATDKCDCA